MPSLFVRYIAPRVGSIQSFFFFDREFQSKIITYAILCLSYHTNMSIMITSIDKIQSNTTINYKALLVEINTCLSITYFPFQVFIFIDGASSGVYNFQVRHPSCVDRITSIDKMQSNTSINSCDPINRTGMSHLKM
jgi:hypothetical protein